MTKWDHIQLEKISKTIDVIDRKKHINHVDFYYRFHGETIIKTDSWRSIPDRMKKNHNRINHVGIDTDSEPILFDFVWYKDNPLETKLSQSADKCIINVLGLFREDLREEILNSGITEGDIETWEKGLITKRK